MMDLPKLYILDVGHGNCAIIQDTNAVTLVDCAPGVTVIETLRELGIWEIEYVLLSHADSDHIGGLSTLLLDERYTIHNVYVNPDPSKKAIADWKTFRLSLTKATKTVPHIKLDTSDSGTFSSGQLSIEILAPDPIMALGGVGGKDINDHSMGTNTLSVAVGIIHGEHRVAILPGDIDQTGLNNLVANQQNIKADILVFPHHGGKAGTGSEEQFANQLCLAVKPKLVIFSNKRGGNNNPQQTIIKGVVMGAPSTHMMCTQLSKLCSPDLPQSTPTHYVALPAKGNQDNSSCGGTIEIEINGKNTSYAPSPTAHRNFIKQFPSPLCLKHLISSPTT